MPGHAPPRRAEGSRRLHVVPRRDGQHLAPHQAREGGRVHHAEGDDHSGEPRAEHGAQSQGEDEGRKREHRVHDPHHEAIHPAPRVAREESEQTSCHHGEGDRSEAGEEGDARAPDNA
jgi:hypothetical protein